MPTCSHRGRTRRGRGIRSGYGGDARSAIDSLTQTVFMVGIRIPDLTQLSIIVAGIPNRRSLIEGGRDGYFSALEDLQAGRLQSASADT
jgi:hypothetical protein